MRSPYKFARPIKRQIDSRATCNSYARKWAIVSFVAFSASPASSVERAGSFPGRTETLPLAVYTQFESQGGLVIPLAISALLVIISLAILLTLKASGLWSRTRPIFAGAGRTT